MQTLRDWSARGLRLAEGLNWLPPLLVRLYVGYFFFETGCIGGAFTIVGLFTRLVSIPNDDQHGRGHPEREAHDGRQPR
jgi:hypothetical protein